LAGIAITSDEEVARMQKQVSGILEYVAKLSAVPTKGVSGTSHVHGVVNAFREDIVKPSLPLEEVKKDAPMFANGGFKVPKIV